MDLQAVTQTIKAVEPVGWAEGGFAIATLSALWRGLRMLGGLEKGQVRIETRFNEHAKDDADKFAKHDEALGEIRKTAGFSLDRQMASQDALEGKVTEIVGNAELRLTTRIESVEQILMRSPRRRG